MPGDAHPRGNPDPSKQWFPARHSSIISKKNHYNKHNIYPKIQRQTQIQAKKPQIKQDKRVVQGDRSRSQGGSRTERGRTQRDFARTLRGWASSEASSTTSARPRPRGPWPAPRTPISSHSNGKQKTSNLDTPDGKKTRFRVRVPMIGGRGRIWQRRWRPRRTLWENGSNFYREIKRKEGRRWWPAGVVKLKPVRHGIRMRSSRESLSGPV